MKNVFILIIIIIVIVGCSSKQKYFLNGKVELIQSQIKENIEIRLYKNVFRERENDLIDLVKTNAKGNFKIEIPDKNTKYKIHISYPNYESYRTDFIMIDENPKLNVNLLPATISEKVSEVSLVGDFNNMNWENAAIMSRIDDNIYEIDVKYDQPKMRYQFLFDTEHHSFSDISNNVDYEYDHGGDYYSIIYSDTSDYKIKVDLNKYPRYSDPEKKEKSSGIFNNSPIFSEYNKIKEDIEKMNLVNYFSMLIYEHQDDKSKKIFFRNASDEKIAEEISNAKIVINKANTYIDSMLTKVIYSQSIDYLLDQKLYLKRINMKSFDFTDFWELFIQIKNLSFTQFSGHYGSFMYKPEFKNNENEYLNIIKKKIKSSFGENQIDKRFFYFYGTLSRFDKSYYNGKKYSEEILKGLAEIEPNLQELKKEIATLKNKVHLYSLDFAPDFSFTDIDGEFYQLSDFKGKWVFLDFWATWCGPCEMEIVNVKNIRQIFSKEELVIIGIAWENDLEKVKEHTKKHNENWITTLDSDEKENSIRSKYGVSSIPSFFLIDNEGKLINTSSGLRGDNMYLEIQKYMKGKKN